MPTDADATSEDATMTSPAVTRQDLPVPPDAPAPFAGRFRQVLGHYATGVTVVAALVDGEPHGITVNSFVSVSLEPPLVSFCAARSSSTWPVLRRADGFAVSVLAAEQDGVCREFAKKGADRFRSVPWRTAPSGHPVIEGALAWLACERAAVQRAGDHDLVLGRVVDLGVDAGKEPLVFYRSRLGTWRQALEG